MTSYDVVVIGAGAAGLSAGALLAAEGKRVLVADRSPVLGGRAMAVPDEGFKVNVGAAAGLRHLVMWNITAFGDPAL